MLENRAGGRYGPRPAKSGPAILWSGVVLFAATAVFIGPRTVAATHKTPRLAPSFPDRAWRLMPVRRRLVSPKAAISRAADAVPAPVTAPFSWDQTVVMREGGMARRLIDGFDPNYNPVGVELDENDFQILSVRSFDEKTGWLTVSAPSEVGGNTESVSFRVDAAGRRETTTHTLTFLLKRGDQFVRATPYLSRSAGDAVAPGRLVGFQWTSARTPERSPKWEADLSGRGGAAAGLRERRYTELRALKVRPTLLGYYVLTVTPRDTPEEDPRGSTSNGAVFLCAYGEENLPPTTDGLLSDDFTPAVGQTITLRPSAVDPETGRTSFTNVDWDFGDGSTSSNAADTVTHAFSAAGIYRVRCTVHDEQGAAATAEDNFVVGATSVSSGVSFRFRKQIRPEEGGIGEENKDAATLSWRNFSAAPGDRVVFVFNRNRFGRRHASDGDGFDAVLDARGRFTATDDDGVKFSVRASRRRLSLKISNANFDRTGDPRLGGAERKGDFANQRLALCVIPADGSAARVGLFSGKLRVRVKGGHTNGARFVPEETVRGSAVR